MGCGQRYGSSDGPSNARSMRMLSLFLPVAVAVVLACLGLSPRGRVRTIVRRVPVISGRTVSCITVGRGGSEVAPGVPAFPLSTTLRCLCPNTGRFWVARSGVSQEFCSCPTIHWSGCRVALSCGSLTLTLLLNLIRSLPRRCVPAVVRRVLLRVLCRVRPSTTTAQTTTQTTTPAAPVTVLAAPTSVLATGPATVLEVWIGRHRGGPTTSAPTGGGARTRCRRRIGGV